MRSTLTDRPGIPMTTPPNDNARRGFQQRQKNRRDDHDADDQTIKKLNARYQCINHLRRELRVCVDKARAAARGDAAADLAARRDHAARLLADAISVEIEPSSLAIGLAAGDLDAVGWPTT